MAKLRLIDDDEIPQIIDLSPGGCFGRDPDNAFVVSHPTVSRSRVSFNVRQGEVELQDLGSANGTFVNGRPLDRRLCLIEHGDQL